MSIVTWTDGPHFKGDGKSRHDLKRDKAAAKEENWRKVCRQVDTRDHYRCRCCGTQGNPDGLDALDRLHRHHLAFRSKGGQDVASNLLLLCPRCHDAVHVKRTLRIEAQSEYGADGALAFWRYTGSHPGSDEYAVKRETSCGVTERD